MILEMVFYEVGLKLGLELSVVGLGLLLVLGVQVCVILQSLNFLNRELEGWVLVVFLIQDSKCTWVMMFGCSRYCQRN